MENEELSGSSVAMRETAARIESGIQRAVGAYLRSGSEQDMDSLEKRLTEERQRREQLERRLGELKEENHRSRQKAEQAERFGQVRDELQQLGVQKVHLAFRLLKDDIYRGEDGDLYADVEGARMPYREYLRHFISENPEFLPPRIAGGSGASGGGRGEISASGIDIEEIRPGMSREQMTRAWKEVARLSGQGSSRW